MAKHIPTSEEIARVIQAREQGLDISLQDILDQRDEKPVEDAKTLLLPADSPTSVRNMTEKVKDLKRSVTDMMKKRAPKSADEIRVGLDLIMQKYDMEPVNELVRMVCETRETDSGETVFVLDPGMRVRILELLAKFRLPVLKAMEVSGSVSHEHVITIVRFGDDGTIKHEKVKGQNAPQAAIDVEVQKEIANG